MQTHLKQNFKKFYTLFCQTWYTCKRAHEVIDLLRSSPDERKKKRPNIIIQGHTDLYFRLQKKFVEKVHHCILCHRTGTHNHMLLVCGPVVVLSTNFLALSIDRDHPFNLQNGNKYLDVQCLC